MSEERSRRLSQIFDPLARFTDHSGAGNSASTPNSPRLLPRRSRDPPPPPPRPIAHPSRLDPLEYELAAADIDSVNWQERCLELQLELHRSRNQATRVRDMLRDKIFCIVSFLVIAETLHEYRIYANTTRDYVAPTGMIVIHSLRLIINIPDIALTVMFIYGAHTKNYKLFRIYYFWSIIITLINIVFRISTTIWYVIQYEIGFGFSLYMFFYPTAIGLIVLGTQIYLILLVRSEMIKLGENCTFSFRNLGAEAECRLKTKRDGAIDGRVKEHEIEIDL